MDEIKLYDYLKSLVRNLRELALEKSASKDAKYPERDKAKKAAGIYEILLPYIERLNKRKSDNVNLVISNYLNGSIESKEEWKIRTIIYPFSSNKSQKAAIKMALNNKISVIEGPPGTGKTQTILNIIANLVSQKKTVAIVSNNNDATENVCEKLKNGGYGDFIARLGKGDNINKFFSEYNERCIDKSWERSGTELRELYEDLERIEGRIDDYYDNKIEVAKLKQDLADTEVEHKHFKEAIAHIGIEGLDSVFSCDWSKQKVDLFIDFIEQIRRYETELADDRFTALVIIKKFLRSRKTAKNLYDKDKLKSNSRLFIVSLVSIVGDFCIKNAYILRLEYLFSFKDKHNNAKGLREKRRLILDLMIRRNYKQYRFKIRMFGLDKRYCQRIEDIKNSIDTLNKEISSVEKDGIIDKQLKISNTLFKIKMYEVDKGSKEYTPNIYDYNKGMLGRFVEKFPIISSSSFSLLKSLKGQILDYVIIDESSQVDIANAAICFACCKNVVIVGDSKQLSHIEYKDKKVESVNDELKKEYEIPNPYDYLNNNILESVKAVFGEQLRSTLLREHYRCHPLIIGFCNKNFYDDQLIVMTHDKKEECPFKIISYKTFKSVHNINAIKDYLKEVNVEEYENTGVIAAWNRTVDPVNKNVCIEEYKDVEAGTIHKYQGREKNIIIFDVHTKEVKDWFDDSRMINVAVSRAKKKLGIIIFNGIKIPAESNVAKLLKYVFYNSNEYFDNPNVNSVVAESKYFSVFEMLYKGYKAEFDKFMADNVDVSGSPAEKIMNDLLLRILSENKNFRAVDFWREYRLYDLVKDYRGLNWRQIEFINRDSRIDFLLYDKNSKEPLLAIEVDGAQHLEAVQKERDEVKDSILDFMKLKYRRFKTSGRYEESKIISALNDIVSRKENTEEKKAS